MTEISHRHSQRLTEILPVLSNWARHTRYLSRSSFVLFNTARVQESRVMSPPLLKPTKPLQRLHSTAQVPLLYLAGPSKPALLENLHTAIHTHPSSSSIIPQYMLILLLTSHSFHTLTFNKHAPSQATPPHAVSIE